MSKRSHRSLFRDLSVRAKDQPQTRASKKPRQDCWHMTHKQWRSFGGNPTTVCSKGRCRREIIRRLVVLLIRSPHVAVYTVEEGTNMVTTLEPSHVSVNGAEVDILDKDEKHAALDMMIALQSAQTPTELVVVYTTSETEVFEVDDDDDDFLEFDEPVLELRGHEKIMDVALPTTAVTYHRGTVTCTFVIP